MSLDKHDAIPVDTHMWQIAVRDYLPHLKKNKTVTDKSYKEIGIYICFLFYLEKFFIWESPGSLKNFLHVPKALSNV